MARSKIPDLGVKIRKGTSTKIEKGKLTEECTKILRERSLDQGRNQGSLPMKEQLKGQVISNSLTTGSSAGPGSLTSVLPICQKMVRNRGTYMPQWNRPAIIVSP